MPSPVCTITAQDLPKSLQGFRWPESFALARPDRQRPSQHRLTLAENLDALLRRVATRGHSSCMFLRRLCEWLLPIFAATGGTVAKA